MKVHQHVSAFSLVQRQVCVRALTATTHTDSEEIMFLILEGEITF